MLPALWALSSGALKIQLDQRFANYFFLATMFSICRR